MIKENLPIIIWTAIIAIVFFISWRKGYLERLRNYVLETREELRKCTWPSWNELKGSTLVVMVTVVLLGAFTVAVDIVIHAVVSWMVI